MTSPVGLRERSFLTTLRVATELWLDKPDGSLVEMVRQALAVTRGRFR